MLNCGQLCSRYDPCTERWTCPCHHSDLTVPFDAMNLDPRGSIATPPSSVASSPRLSTRQTRRRNRRDRQSSLALAPENVCSMCSSTTCDHIQSRTEKKNMKERENRSDLQSSIQLMQDVLLCFVYSSEESDAPTRQNENNATSSGLVYKKIELSRDGMAVFIGMLQEAAKKAMFEGNPEELKAKYQEWIKRARICEDPTAGSWMYNPGPMCFHEPGSKSCAVHQEAKWWDCRRDKVDVNFRHNVTQFEMRRPFNNRL